MERKSGYLVKRAVNSGRNWKKRYFVLENTTLRYYKKEGQKKANGEFELTSDSEIADFNIDKRECLQLKTPTKTLYVQAESAPLKMEWLNAINKAINFHSGDNQAAVDEAVRQKDIEWQERMEEALRKQQQVTNVA